MATKLQELLDELKGLQKILLPTSGAANKLEQLINKYNEITPTYPIGGYAPGNYSCTCIICKKEFIGDKRAVQCKECAIM